LDAVCNAMSKLPELERRKEVLLRAGYIYEYPPFCFQVSGADAEIIAGVLKRLTDTGHVPEALRVAHLITSAVVKGESGRQA
jgi:uncharacterized protein